MIDKQGRLNTLQTVIKRLEDARFDHTVGQHLVAALQDTRAYTFQHDLSAFIHAIHSKHPDARIDLWGDQEGWIAKVNLTEHGIPELGEQSTPELALALAYVRAIREVLKHEQV